MMPSSKLINDLSKQMNDSINDKKWSKNEAKKSWRKEKNLKEE
jgi:hypothetical protein